MGARLAILLFVLSVAGATSGCAAMNARRAFNTAEKAKKQGDYDAALKGYEEAARTDPSKDEYKRALITTRKEAAETHAGAALEAEKRSDYEAAVKHWSEAQRVDPESGEYSARVELARLKTKRADPVEYFEAAKKLNAALPNDAGAKKTLEEAKQAAISYHLRLAETYTDAKSWDKALEEFEIAKRIDPENAVFKSAAYRTAEARRLEAVGDEKMKNGDSLGAYQAYERASSLTSDRNLETKMNRARRGAGSTLEQLDQARAYEQLAKWEDAAELYTVLAARAGSPAEVTTRAAAAREKSAKIRADRAKAFAERGLAPKACAELLLALEHTDAKKEILDLLTSAVEDMSANNPGEASRKLEAASQAAPNLAVVAVAPDIALLVAKNAYEEAQKVAERSPAEAMLAVSKLEPFSAKLKGYAAFKDKLVKKAFGALIAEAERAADAGNYQQAAEMLQAALQVSKPPENMADHLKRGTAALAKKEWDEARTAFDAALAVSAKSNLAKAGKKVAALARLVELKAEANEARAVEDSVRAAAAYRAILELDPTNAEARDGNAALKDALANSALKSAKDNQAAGRAGAAYVYFRRVVDIDPQNAEAKTAIAALEKQLAGAGGEPEAMVHPLNASDAAKSACPQVAAGLRDRIALYLTKTNKLGARYLEHDQEKLVDEKKRLPPPIALNATLESCSVSETGGNASVKVGTAVGATTLIEDKVDAKFDPSTLPKDERDGMDVKRMEKALLAEVGKTVANHLRNHAAKLAEWRTIEADSSMKSNDAEAAARIYATFASAATLSENERRMVRELERFLMNKYR